MLCLLFCQESRLLFKAARGTKNYPQGFVDIHNTKLASQREGVIVQFLLEVSE